jgi:hypothetical protein
MEFRTDRFLSMLLFVTPPRNMPLKQLSDAVTPSTFTSLSDRSSGHPFGVVVRARNSLRDLHDPGTASAQLESTAQRDSAAKAALPLARFCPDKSMAPVFGDCVDGGGIALKRVKARPRWRDC